VNPGIPAGQRCPARSAEISSVILVQYYQAGIGRDRHAVVGLAGTVPRIIAPSRKPHSSPRSARAGAGVKDQAAIGLWGACGVGMGPRSVIAGNLSLLFCCDIGIVCSR
jgi:hypothetical protein